MKSKPNILVTPLDWGLGHATRCMPVIQQLLKADYNVIIAASGASATLLKAEFPECQHLAAPFAHFTYSKYRWFFSIKILLQLLKLKKLAKQETAWLSKMVEKHAIALVISDNRFGMHHPKTPCVYISHQLGLKTGFGKWIDRAVQQNKYKVLNKFIECWVPDFTDNDNIAGVLSRPGQLPNIPVKFIGLLSRINNTEVMSEPGRILIMLSGPEPQRSILEKIINSQLPSIRGKLIFVRGLPNGGNEIIKHKHVAYYNHLTSENLSEQIYKAEYIICRSGYSSVMDILQAGKKAIYIPTPGQTEQEYLAKHLADKKYAVWFPQSAFKLMEALACAKATSYDYPTERNKTDCSVLVDAILGVKRYRALKAVVVNTNF